MPTVGWIQEGDWDRFFEARSRPARVPVQRITFQCSWCGAAFASYEDLCRHTSLQHPLELPALHLRGEPLLRDSVVRTRLEPSDVHLVQCSYCEVQENGGGWHTVEPEEFQRRLADCSEGVWNVRIVNDQTGGGGVSDRYRIRFSIPDPSGLDAVDELFVRTLAVEELQHADLTAFEAALPKSSSAREYGAALGDYALGLLLKERRAPLRLQHDLSETVGRMRSALETLRLFERPVAQVVSGIVRFNLNDFQHARPTGSAELDAGIRLFRKIAGIESTDDCPAIADVEPGAVIRSAICPIDTVSYKLLSTCERAVTGTLSEADVESLERMSAEEPLNEYDVPKVHALCAYAFLTLGHAVRVRSHLRVIRFNPWLQSWVRRQLDEYMPDEN